MREIGFSRSVIYGGFKLFKALYVKTALYYFNRLFTGSQFNSWNTSDDGVVKSAHSIIQAVRFWSFIILSRFVEEVAPTQQTLSLIKNHSFEFGLYSRLSHYTHCLLLSERRPVI